MAYLDPSRCGVNHGEGLHRSLGDLFPVFHLYSEGIHAVNTQHVPGL